MRYKYDLSNETIPQEQREMINSKIEYIINNGLSESETGILKADIFNAYTGKGGLHGLSYKDFSCYYDYQKAKSEIEQGQFFTPYPLVSYIYDCLHVSENDLVADLTSGHGAFISCCPNEHNFYGCELDVQPFNVSKYLYPDAKLENTDIRFYKPGVVFDYVVGNPPYNLIWRKEDKSYLSEVYYCIKAAELMKPAGIMAIIVPESFCEDEFSDKTQIATISEYFNFVCQIKLDKNTFKHLGVTNYSTKIIILQRKSKHIEDSPYKVGEYVELSDPNIVWSKYLKEITEKRQGIKRQLFLELMQNSKGDSEWREKVKKLLFDIKRNKKVSVRYAEACEYINRFETQEKPDYMNYEEWEKNKIRESDVIKMLKSILRSQNGRKSQENRLIKDNYRIRFNGIAVSISDLVIGNASFCGKKEKWLSKYINRKRKEYECQSRRFEDMEQDEKIADWLDSLVFESPEENIRLNTIQKHDINLFLQKRYNFIQWEQGSGKTLAGITIGKYRLEKNNVRNVFVVSTAIAIKNNWCDVLTQFGIKYILIEKLSDIDNIKNGDFVVLTLGMMVKYYKHLKKFVKQINQKAVLIFDESDSISNINSKRTKAILSVFRKLKYTTLMTGTSTRNNISEIFSQLELLYNNSFNMISEARTITVKNRDGNPEEIPNDNYLKPYPAYKKGFKLFTASHIPEKVTVFGVSQFIQDINNADVLKKIIDKTIITRTFETITGRKLYEIKQFPCSMGKEERAVYEIALNKFYEMEYLFKKTGNARKDAMLKILNQLLALLKICAAPQTIKQYDSSILPEKFKTVLSLLKKWESERVAIGVRHISVAKQYEKAIKAAFPGRKVFLITGNEATLNQRKRIVKKLKETENGILISTQQSLSASMNIDFVDKCIIPELHWNNSSMGQYYFRFIRYTSQHFKTVAFVTYENSIETNLLKMVLVKDKLNLFMKSQEVTDDELYDRFGVDSSMLRNLMYKEKTEDGYVLRWGEQKIS